MSLSDEPIADKFINRRNRISSFRLNFFFSKNCDSFFFFFYLFLFSVVLIALEHDGIVTFSNDELNDSCHSKIDNKYADYKYAYAHSIGQNCEFITFL